MPLTLLAGPANSGKVTRLLERYLDALDRPVTTPHEVRSVVITLVTESVFDVPRAPVTVFSTRVRLRNR